jgi:hypothetical protein
MFLCVRFFSRVFCLRLPATGGLSERSPVTSSRDLLRLRQQFNRRHPACKQNHNVQGDRAQDQLERSRTSGTARKPGQSGTPKTIRSTRAARTSGPTRISGTARTSGNLLGLLFARRSNVAQTNPVGISGTYFISASVLPFVASGDSFTFCYDTLASSGSASQYGVGDTSDGYIQASISDVLFVGAGDSVKPLCYSGGTAGDVAFNAGITATLITAQTRPRRRIPAGM